MCLIQPQNETFIMVSRIYVIFQIRLIRTFLAANLSSKALFLRIIYSVHSYCLCLHVQSRNCPRNSLIMKWQTAYIFSKRFYKALNTTYAEPKWNVGSLAELHIYMLDAASFYVSIFFSSEHMFSVRRAKPGALAWGPVPFMETLLVWMEEWSNISKV